MRIMKWLMFGLVALAGSYARYTGNPMDYWRETNIILFFIFMQVVLLEKTK